MARIFIGRGHLTWNMPERVTNRYGSVCLMETMSEGDGGASGGENKGIAEIWTNLKGYGRLVAVVQDPRESYHVGDQHRDIMPSLPDKGEEIILGEGEAFYDKGWDDFPTIGVKPLDGREDDWLDPNALYRAHSSVVNLEWIPLEKPVDVHQVPKRENTGDISVCVIIKDGYMQAKQN